MATRALPAALAQLPNALTIARLALVPVFVWVLLAAEDGHSWLAAVLFGIAGVTDQIDGWLARRWRIESDFGRVADPLADRLMIDAAVVLLWLAERLPWPALAVILVRDTSLIVGYKLLVPRGYVLSVSQLGKIATWILYAALAAILATKQAAWPLWLFWAGLVLAVAAGIAYIGSALEDRRA